MGRGRSIRIYLDGGEVSGIRHAELVNWTGQAVLCPRSRVGELGERWQSVVCRPGVYFLVGGEDQSGREVYIGEAEDVLYRLKQHVAKKEWQEAIIFTSKDENLTKAHVKFLESHLVTRARDAHRYAVQNDKTPPMSGLPRADQDAMAEYMDQVPLLLGVLGHRILDPVTSAAPASSGQRRFFYTVKEAKASGMVTDEGFVVLKGSTALKGTTPAMAPGWIAFKEELVMAGKLAPSGELLVFAEDVLFNSPSAAAAVVYGNNANGRMLWRTEDGHSLKEIEELEAGATGLSGK